MKPSFIIFFLLIFYASYSQEKKFVETDSSIIQIKEGFSGSLETKEWLKGKNLIYYHYKSSEGAIQKGVYDTMNRRIGSWSQYDEKGALIRTENFDDRTYAIFKKEYYPFKPLLDNMKNKADSLVISIYGKDFFHTQLKWSLRGSYFNFDGGRGSSWTDTTTIKPKTFMFRYDIFHDEELYEGLVEFKLDENGQFIGNKYEEIYGFEKLVSTTSKTFSLTHKKATLLARQQGLVETDTTKARAFLKWESYKTENFYNGHYRVYVLINTGIIKDIRPNSRSSVTERYDAYVFNPWTGEFIGKKKMKVVRSWERYGGNNTGLIPDE